MVKILTARDRELPELNKDNLKETNRIKNPVSNIILNYEKLKLSQ
jgi:hypothetical protein